MCDEAEEEMALYAFAAMPRFNPGDERREDASVRNYFPETFIWNVVDVE